MNTPEIPVPINNHNGLLLALQRNLPKILNGLGITFLVFNAGCVLNPREGDILVADRNVMSDFCPIKRGTQIILDNSEIVPVAGAANQTDTMWNATAPGCGDIGIANATVISSFSRVKQP